MDFPPKMNKRASLFIRQVRVESLKTSDRKITELGETLENSKKLAQKISKNLNMISNDLPKSTLIKQEC